MKQQIIKTVGAGLFATALSAATVFGAGHNIEMTNVSTRGMVGEGEKAMIVGVIIEGEEDATIPVLFRTLGPSMADLGVVDVVGDTSIDIYARDTEAMTETLIWSNDNWQDQQHQFISSTGLAPMNELEAAGLAMLSPGLYTMQVSGDIDGIALGEAFDIALKIIPASLIDADDFGTLVAAVVAADLVDILSGDGPFTVFAPTDEAFSNLPEGTIEALLNDIPALTNILLYHVVSGAAVYAADVTAGEVGMANGFKATLTTDNGGVQIEGANVIEADFAATNGVIHVIDTVILPPEVGTGNIVEELSKRSGFDTLIAAVTAAGLVDALSASGERTLFAPNDEAFAKLPEGTVEDLLNNIPALTDILLYHLFQGASVEAALVSPGNITMANDKEATLATENMGVQINDANVIEADVEATNGIIHVIDTVIIPPST
jgi:uncharacterized surface protein with fasciclin (FAS1) repeats